MGKLEIITDHKWKMFKYRDEVPQKQVNDYDWLSEEEKTDGWIWYRKRVYHISEFMDLNNKFHNPNHPFPAPWNGYISDSFFSGILIEISEDGEMYRIGTYLS